MIELTKSLMPNNYSYKSFHTTFALYKKKIIKIGINKPKHTHPFNLQFDYLDRQQNNISHEVGLHSELSCFLKLGSEDTSNLTFVNVRVDKNNELNYSKPCHGCQQALKLFGFKKMYYSCIGGKFEEFVLT